MIWYRLLWLILALPIAAPAAAECALHKIAELPVTMEGMRPIVPATLNGTEVKLIADSGAYLSLISPSMAAQLGLKLERMPIGFHLKGIGGNAPSAKTEIANFGLLGSNIPNVVFLVGGSDNGRAGLLGLNVLSVADTEYDLAGGAIRLFRSPGCTVDNPAYWAGGRHVSSIELSETSRRNPHIVGTVSINGIPMRAVFDTGAPKSMLTLEAAAKAGITPEGVKARPDGIARGLGPNVARSWTASFDYFAIGDEQIRNARLRFSEMPGFDYDLLLGADFFLAHRIFVSTSSGRIALTYNGGAVFDSSGTVSVPTSALAAGQSMADADTPTGADGFARRGAAYAARRDFPHALSDLSHAIALAPDNPAYLYARASAYRANRQLGAAMADLNAAIALKPDYVEALIDRAAIYLSSGERPAGLADLKAAARAAPDGGNMHMALAELYVRADAYDLAVSQYGQWLAKHGSQDSRYSQALNGRCWARAMLGRELDEALIDCNTAVRAAPDAAGYRDTRGLLRLRMGQLDRAIADYDTALAMQPNIAWSLYGRGIARHRKHLQAEGDADIAAALAIDPTIATQAQRYGISIMSPTPR